MKAQIRFMGTEQCYPITNAIYIADYLRSVTKNDRLNIKGMGELDVFATYDPHVSPWNCYEIVVMLPVDSKTIKSRGSM